MQTPSTILVTIGYYFAMCKLEFQDYVPREVNVLHDLH